MSTITFWTMLHYARTIKDMGWPLPMRLAFLAGMVAAIYQEEQMERFKTIVHSRLELDNFGNRNEHGESSQKSR